MFWESSVNTTYIYMLDIYNRYLIDNYMYLVSVFVLKAVDAMK